MIGNFLKEESKQKHGGRQRREKLNSLQQPKPCCEVLGITTTNEQGPRIFKNPCKHTRGEARRGEARRPDHHRHHRLIGSVLSWTARRSDTSASDLRLHFIRASTKKHVSSFVLPSGTSTTKDSITNVPGRPSMHSGCRVMMDEQFCRERDQNFSNLKLDPTTTISYPPICIPNK